MKQKRIRDNSKTPKSEFYELQNLTAKIADRTLGQLEKDGIFVFPETLSDTEDIEKDQFVLKSFNNDYQSSNIMGFIGLENERLVIGSRFDNDENSFFLQYMLQKVMGFPNIVNLETDANQDSQIFNLILLMFPHYFKAAMRKGVYKTYIRYEYNDSNIKGTIDVQRHIAKNTPFVGNIAYNTREYSYDNFLTELIRHTIEFIKSKPYGNNILSKVKDEVRLINTATQSYRFHDRAKIIRQNKKNVVRHTYYREYRALQQLCIMILQEETHNIGMGPNQIYGILFDGSWLWEEYVNYLIDKWFDHPNNRRRKDAQYLFEGKQGQIYPDFIGSKNSDNRIIDNRIIADAKYKPIDNIGNRDYLQVLAYMYRFDSKKGFYLYPEADEKNDKTFWMNKGTTYENNITKREDVCVIKHGLKIPKGAENYKTFVDKIEISEQKFKEDIQTRMNQQLLNTSDIVS